MSGRAELNVDFCATIPVLTITGSFGVPVEQALDIRESISEPVRTPRYIGFYERGATVIPVLFG